MPYEWDEAKNRANLDKHKIAFEAIHGFDWDNATYEDDHRHDEPRTKATGFIGVTLYTVIYTERGDTTRIISIWKSGPRDRRRYERQVR